MALNQVLDILRDNRLAAIATIDPDGAPHCTMIGIANEGLRLYFVIARNSQKMIDLERDSRVSMAIGRDVINPGSIRALAINGTARPVTDPAERRDALKLLMAKRPALQQLEEPTDDHSAVMVAIPKDVRLLDYSTGYGHSVLFTLDPEGNVLSSDEQVHDWGYGNEARPVS